MPIFEARAKEVLNPMALLASNHFSGEEGEASFPAIQFIKKGSRLVCCSWTMNN
jgi:hypothetical protein